MELSEHFREMVGEALRDNLQVEIMGDKDYVEVAIYFDGELISDDRIEY